MTSKFLFNEGLTDSLTTGQVGVICGVTPQTVINWIEGGKFSFTRLGRGPRRIPAGQVLDFLKKNNAPIPDWLKKLDTQAA